MTEPSRGEFFNFRTDFDDQPYVRLHPPLDLPALKRLRPRALAKCIAAIVAERNPGLTRDSIAFGRQAQTLYAVITNHQPPRRTNPK